MKYLVIAMLILAGCSSEPALVWKLCQSNSSLTGYQKDKAFRKAMKEPVQFEEFCYVSNVTKDRTLYCSQKNRFFFPFSPKLVVHNISDDLAEAVELGDTLIVSGSASLMSYSHSIGCFITPLPKNTVKVRQP